MAVEAITEDGKHYKELWLEAKQNASASAKGLKDASKDLKKAQDQALAADEKAEEALRVREELVEAQRALEASQAEAKALSKQLKKAESQAAAAVKIAEGLAELSK